jgi:CRP-like cAMP-binding protein
MSTMQGPSPYLHQPCRKMLSESINRSFLKNRILARLSLADLGAMGGFLEPVALKDHMTLQEPRQPVDFAYFIESGVVSLRIVATGCILETALVGYRGATGVASLLGAHIPTQQSMVLFQGHALRIRATDLQSLMDERPQIREQLSRYVGPLVTHCAQSGLCGVRHHLEQRLACWLCLACDAHNSKALPVTHDYLAYALGLRRTGITAALAHFERRGLIRKTRGLLQISDRASLQARSCGCYGLIAGAYASAEQPTLVE